MHVLSEHSSRVLHGQSVARERHHLAAQLLVEVEQGGALQASLVMHRCSNNLDMTGRAAVQKPGVSTYRGHTTSGLKVGWVKRSERQALPATRRDELSRATYQTTDSRAWRNKARGPGQHGDVEEEVEDAGCPVALRRTPPQVT